jgi:crotonobetainyl-CoA:carnitine CoA-transferase CaiB-like acyl-CoA transferase
MIESFRPGTLENMGLAPAELLSEHPRLVVLRISGFGQTGPYSSRPGFGTLAEGMSGFAHLNGETGGEPLLPPLALADMIAGLYGCNAVLMALRARDCDNGKGQVIDLSLLDAMVSVMGPEPLDYSLTGKPKPRTGNGSNTSCPRNAYRSRDGYTITISASIQKMAENLFRSIGRADMIDDPRYATNDARVKHRLEVDRIIGGWIEAHTREEVLARFEADGVTAAPLYDIADISADKHFIERGVYVEVPDTDLGSIAMHAPVPRLSATPGSLRSPAPALGQHTTHLLAEASFTDIEIQQLLYSGAVAESKPT